MKLNYSAALLSITIWHYSGNGGENPYSIRKIHNKEEIKGISGNNNHKTVQKVLFSFKKYQRVSPILLSLTVSSCNYCRVKFIGLSLNTRKYNTWIKIVPINNLQPETNNVKKKTCSK